MDGAINSPRVADGEQIASFVDALFRHADDGTYVSLRAFPDDREGPPFAIEAVCLGENGIAHVIDAATDLATRCANAPTPVVFCPPAATFSNPRKADQDSLANGLALSVECDSYPVAAREWLEGLLGPATLVVASGGEWIDTATGEVQLKLHLHWRLTEPTRSTADHVRLKSARQMATRLVGADASNIPAGHPIRWAGSWHRKGAPRLARIVALNEDAEIELGDAIERLNEASGASAPTVPAPDGGGNLAGIFGPDEFTRQRSSEPTADPLDVAAALAVIPNQNVEWDAWNRVGMAAWRATNGTGFASFDGWSQKSSKYDAATTRARWEHYFTSPPTQIGAGTLFHLAKEACPGWRKPSAYAREAAMAAEPPPPADGLCLSVADWLARDIPDPDFLLGGWLHTASRVMLVAPTGLGKTNIMMALGFAIALGQGFLHWQGHRRARVLYIDGEMSRRLLKRRLADAVRRAGGVPDGFFALCKDDLVDDRMQPLNAPQGQIFIDQVIEANGGVDLVIFDNVQALISGDMKEEQGWAATLEWAKGLTRRSIGQIWVHHTGHEETHSYGTKTREWQLDTVIMLKRCDENRADIAFEVNFTKSRERMPDNRKDFEPAKVRLVCDEWVVDEVEKPGSPPGKAMAPKARVYYDALCEAIVDHGQARPRICGSRISATMQQWQNKCGNRGLLDAAAGDKRRHHAENNAFHRYKRELIQSGHVVVSGDVAWTTDNTLRASPSSDR